MLIVQALDVVNYGSHLGYLCQLQFMTVFNILSNPYSILLALIELVYFVTTSSTSPLKVLIDNSNDILINLLDNASVIVSRDLFNKKL